MADSISRREFAATIGGVAGAAVLVAEASAADPKPEVRKPVEAAFERDYEAPKFQPSWKKPQINRELVQDFVMFGHGDFEMTKKLLEKEPMLLSASVDWGGGDWESALGAASHVGNREIAGYLLEKGARADIFTFTMLGQLEIVQAFLKLQPKLIDAKGPHGLGLHIHAKMGGKESEKVLEFLQGVKKVEFPMPKKKA